MALSEDSPLGKTVLDMAQQFVHCLEELSIHKDEVKELEELIQRCNINLSSFLKKSTKMYKNHVESIREAVYCRETCRRRLVILQLSAII